MFFLIGIKLTIYCSAISRGLFFLILWCLTVCPIITWRSKGITYFKKTGNLQLSLFLQFIVIFVKIEVYSMCGSIMLSNILMCCVPTSLKSLNSHSLSGLIFSCLYLPIYLSESLIFRSSLDSVLLKTFSRYFLIQQ